MRKYCMDCETQNETMVYNDKCDPPLLNCAECGQFVYDADDPNKNGKSAEINRLRWEHKNRREGYGEIK